MSKRGSAARISAVILMVTAGVVASYAALPAAGRNLGKPLAGSMFTTGECEEHAVAPIDPQPSWSMDCSGTYEFNESDQVPFSVSASECAAFCDTLNYLGTGRMNPVYWVEATYVYDTIPHCYFSANNDRCYSYKRVAVGHHHTTGASGSAPLHVQARMMILTAFTGLCDSTITTDDACADAARTTGMNHDEAQICYRNPRVTSSGLECADFAPSQGPGITSVPFGSGPLRLTVVGNRAPGDSMCTMTAIGHGGVPSYSYIWWRHNPNHAPIPQASDTITFPLVNGGSSGTVLVARVVDSEGYYDPSFNVMQVIVADAGSTFPTGCD